MKIIFLDIDGVFNCKTTMQRHRGYIGIDPYLAFIFAKEFIDTDIKIVLSSSWRHAKQGQEEVRKQVIDFIDCTPSLPGMTVRGDEIKAWLDAHPEVEKYAIVDDDSDMLPEQMPNLFQTSWETGITTEIIEKIKKHFSNEQ